MLGRAGVGAAGSRAPGSAAFPSPEMCPSCRGRHGVGLSCHSVSVLANTSSLAKWPGQVTRGTRSRRPEQAGAAALSAAWPWQSGTRGQSHPMAV